MGKRLGPLANPTPALARNRAARPKDPEMGGRGQPVPREATSTHPHENDMHAKREDIGDATQAGTEREEEESVTERECEREGNE